MSGAAGVALVGLVVGAGVTFCVLALIGLWRPEPPKIPTTIRYRWVLNGVPVSEWKRTEIRSFTLFHFRFGVDPLPEDVAAGRVGHPPITLLWTDSLVMELEATDD
jgi:hypothetical protein